MSKPSKTCSSSTVLNALEAISMNRRTPQVHFVCLPVSLYVPILRLFALSCPAVVVGLVRLIVGRFQLGGQSASRKNLNQLPLTGRLWNLQ